MELFRHMLLGLPRRRCILLFGRRPFFLLLDVSV